MEQQVKKLKVSIKTLGCQMNVYDSEVAQGLLANQGFEIVHELDFPENPKESAQAYRGIDVVIMNTCSVREHAEDRVLSRLGTLGKAKEENPNLVIALMGCM